jgi:N-acetyl-anhydromuramyl-L-alanine amidase AmpD
MAVTIRWAGYPRSYTPGRRKRIMGVCLHYTAGAEGPLAAENGAAYDRKRTDGVSTGYFVDSDGAAVQEVPDKDRSHTARFHGNEIFIHIEICGTRQTRAQWLDETSSRTLRTAAQLTAVLLLRHDLPIRRMTVAEVRRAYYSNANANAPQGVCDHYDCTRAFPEDGGDHTDVGAAFPWDVFMEWVRFEYETERDMSILGLRKGNSGDRVAYLHRLMEQAGFPVAKAERDAKSYSGSTSTQLLALRKSVKSGATSGDVVSADAAEQVLRVHAKKAAAVPPPADPTPVPGPSDPGLTAGTEVVFTVKAVTPPGV